LTILRTLAADNAAAVVADFSGIAALQIAVAFGNADAIQTTELSVQTGAVDIACAGRRTLAVIASARSAVGIDFAGGIVVIRQAVTVTAAELAFATVGMDRTYGCAEIKVADFVGTALELIAAAMLNIVCTF